MFNIEYSKAKHCFTSKEEEGRKTISTHREFILKSLLAFCCVAVIGVTTVFLSKFINEAILLRNWRNETKDYVTITTIVNASVYRMFLEFLKSVSLNGNSNIDTTEITNFTVSIQDSGIGVYEPVTENIPQNFKHSDEFYTTEKNCRPLPTKDDFAECGNRVAERKCCEYIWAWKYKDAIMDHDSCVSDNYGVIGGKIAEPGQFPHMVAVGFKRRHTRSSGHKYSYKCGGTLISERFVLTAAHCTSLGNDPLHYKEPQVVAMGGNYILEQMKLKKIDKIIKHDKYKSPLYYYDISLLRLLHMVYFSYKIHPACLSTKFHPQYTEVNVTGWGTTDPRDTTLMSENLQVATVQMINRTTCLPMMRGVATRKLPKKLLPHQLCAGVLDRTIDTCQGDSGGPLQVRINTSYGNIHEIIGVTSFGKSCAAKRPSVYVSVSAVITWIEKHVWPDN